jgi:hypothetical protein
MNILEAIDDPNLLGASIRDPDAWKPWRALLTAATFWGKFPAHPVAHGHSPRRL